MSNQFLKLRRSAVPGKIPDTGSLALGEIALNTYDGLAFMKKDGINGEEVVVIGNTSGSFSGSFSGEFTGSLFGTASWAINALTASSADDFYVRGDITGSNAVFTGTLTAQTLVVQTISSSIIYSSGSNIFGNQLTDTQQFTGSVTITGSLTAANVNLTGSFSGSIVGLIDSASYAVSSSQAETASLAILAPAYTTTASFNQFTGSYQIDSASWNNSIDLLSSSYNSFSSSYLIDSASWNNNIDLLSSSYTSFSSSYLIDSASWNNSIDLLSQSFLQTSQSLSASIELLSGSFLAFSQSYNTGSFTGSFYGNLSGSFSGSLSNLQGTPTHIPYFSSSQVLTDSTMFQVDNGPGQGYSIAINQNGVTAAAPEALYVWQDSTSSFNVISGKGNLNNYLQLNIQNTNQGTSASSDIVATANNGSETTFYVDMGINNENYIDNGNGVGSANDAYVYSVANNLHIGNAASNGSHLAFFVGGFNTDDNNKLQLNPDNVHFMSGSLQITGSLNVLEGITGSLFGTSSWAISASHAPSALTSSYALSASYAVTSSYANTATQAETASSADNFFIRQDVTASNALIYGTLTAQTIYAQYITSSTEYVTGSTIFGSQLTDTHQFTGSVTITGSLSVNNDPVVTETPYNNFSQSIQYRATELELTASILTSASASLAQDSGSNSIRLTDLEATASVLTQASASFSSSIAYLSSSFISFSQSYNTGSFTGSFIGEGNLTGSLFGSASYALTASYALNVPLTASYALQALSSSYAVTASYSNTSTTASYALSALSASYAANVGFNYTASFTNQSTWVVNHNLDYRFVIIQAFDTNYDEIIPANIELTDNNNATVTFPTLESGYVVVSIGGASYNNTVSASYAATASYLTGTITSASNAISASYALTASYFSGSITNADNAISASYALTSSYLNPIVNSQIILTQVSQSLNFADDAAAAFGGVPLGGLYRNGNFILIRIV